MRGGGAAATSCDEGVAATAAIRDTSDEFMGGDGGGGFYVTYRTSGAEGFRSHTERVGRSVRRCDEGRQERCVRRVQIFCRWFCGTMMAHQLVLRNSSREVAEHRKNYPTIAVCMMALLTPRRRGLIVGPCQQPRSYRRSRHREGPGLVSARGNSGGWRIACWPRMTLRRWLA